MRGVWKLVATEAKLFFREPIGMFFTVGWPLVLLFITGSVYGNKPNPIYGGLGSVDFAVPGYMAMIIGTTGLIGLPVDLATYRELRVLRRFRITPMHPSAVMFAQIVVNLAATAASTAVLIILGRVLYGLHLPQTWLPVLLGFVVATLSLYACGFVLGALLPKARTAMVAGMAILFPQLMLSGAFGGAEAWPPNVQRIANFLPMTQMVNLLRGLWNNANWNVTALLALGATMVVGLVLSTVTFRWD